MRETVEFRVVERFAPLLFSEKEGKRLGDSIRQVEMSTDDPRIRSVAELQHELSAKYNTPFFFGWKIRREYTAAELAAADVLQLRPTTYFEPAGEECGTQYDELSACTQCGSGATQLTPLVLDVKRIPKGRDFAETIGREVVVSRRACVLFRNASITGAALVPVRTRRGDISDEWYQLMPRDASAIIVPPTVVGIDPVDADHAGRERCPNGDLLGLNLLSEVSIRADSRGMSDVVASRQFIGVRRGLLRPERVIMVSPKVWRLAVDNRLKGCEFEVVHLV